MSKDSDDVSPPQNLDPVKTPAQIKSPHNERDCDQRISELLQAVHARDDFITVAAHELRNPITPIQLCVGLIRTAEAAGDYAKVAAELTRLERLLERFLKRTEVLLNVTQLASGKLHLEAAETNLSDLAHGVIDGLRPLPHPSHMSIDEAIEAGRGLGAKRVWLTHLTHLIDHETTEATLPAGFCLAYDGLRIRI